MNELLRSLLNLPAQASEMAFEVDVLHYVVISVTMAGAVGVAAVLAVFSYRYSAARAPDHSPDADSGRRSTPGFSTPRWLEAGLVAGLLFLFTGFWVVGFGQFVRMATPKPGAMPIYASGKQWMWSFAYPDGSGSKGILYVPVNQPIKLMLTSRDVIHSFYVPAFRIKQDAVPGRMTVTSFTPTRQGRYELFCAEYCGTDHSRMMGEVVVLSEVAFARFLDGRHVGAERSFGQADDLAAQGLRIAAEKGCLRCHTVDGTPHVGPTWVGVFGTEIALRGRGPVHADEAYLTRSMMDPTAQVRAGFDPVMPSYQGQLEAGEVAALVQYIRSLGSRPPRTRAPLPVAPLPEVPTAPRGVFDRPGPRDERENVRQAADGDAP